MGFRGDRLISAQMDRKWDKNCIIASQKHRNSAGSEYTDNNSMKKEVCSIGQSGRLQSARKSQAAGAVTCPPCLLTSEKHTRSACLPTGSWEKCRYKMPLCLRYFCLLQTFICLLRASHYFLQCFPVFNDKTFRTIQPS